MSIVLLLGTTALSMGFFWLIGMEQVSYITLTVCLAILAGGIWTLYRHTPKRKQHIIPYLQEQSLRWIMSATCIRALHYRLMADRPIIISTVLTLYGGCIIWGTTTNTSIVVRQGTSGYILTALVGFFLGQHHENTFSLTLLMWLMIAHRSTGMLMATYWRKHHPDRTDALYKYLVYLGYALVVFVIFMVMPYELASLTSVIGLGRLLISLPTHTIDVTPDYTIPTAEDILQGKLVHSDTASSITPSRGQRIGIQPHHGTLLIRSIIAILIANIAHQIAIRYSPGQLSLREIGSCITLTVICSIIFTIYYLSHRHDDTMTLRKTTVIILSNIAIGISIVHLFYPHTRSIIIGAITRNTLNNIALWRLFHSRYRHTLHDTEYYYRTAANTTITLINSILIITRFHHSSRESTAIILIGYRGVQGLLVYPTYQHFSKHSYQTPAYR